MDQATVIAVDFNRTLCGAGGPDPAGWGPPTSSIDPETGVETNAAEAMRQLRRAGYVVAVNSVVGDADAIREWCDRYGIEYDYVNESPAQPLDSSHKLNAAAYIDDRAVPFRGSWSETLADLFASGVLEKGLRISWEKAGYPDHEGRANRRREIREQEAAEAAATEARLRDEPEDEEAYVPPVYDKPPPTKEELARLSYEAWTRNTEMGRAHILRQQEEANPPPPPVVERPSLIDEDYDPTKPRTKAETKYEVRRILCPGYKHCTGCQQQAAEGWMPEEDMVEPYDCECGEGCKCTFAYREATVDENTGDKESVSERTADKSVDEGYVPEARIPELQAIAAEFGGTEFESHRGDPLYELPGPDDRVIEVSPYRGRIDIAFNSESRGYGEFPPEAQLQPGSVELIRTLYKLLGRLATLGLPIKYSAEPRRARSYESMLTKLGWTLVRSDGYVFEWAPPETEAKSLRDFDPSLYVGIVEDLSVRKSQYGHGGLVVETTPAGGRSWAWTVSSYDGQPIARGVADTGSYAQNRVLAKVQAEMWVEENSDARSPGQQFREATDRSLDGGPVHNSNKSIDIDVNDTVYVPARRQYGLVVAMEGMNATVDFENEDQEVYDVRTISLRPGTTRRRAVAKSLSTPQLATVDGVVVKKLKTAVADVFDDDRVIIMVMTTGRTDRDNETVDPTGGDFSEFALNPVYINNHQTGEDPIGSLSTALAGPVPPGMTPVHEGVSVWNDYIGDGTRYEKTANGVRLGEKRMALLGKVYFSKENPEADRKYRMAKEGTLQGGSISFLPIGGTKSNHSGGTHYPRWKLLEYTTCAVGSNPDSVALTKSLDLRPVGECWYAYEGEVQLDGPYGSRDEGTEAVKKMLSVSSVPVTKADDQNVDDLDPSLDDPFDATLDSSIDEEGEGGEEVEGLQLTDVRCGDDDCAAALVASLLGLTIDDAPPVRDVVDAENMLYLLQEGGLEADVVTVTEDVFNDGIVVCQLMEPGHWVATTGAIDDEVGFQDPVDGPSSLPTADFIELVQNEGTGFLVTWPDDDTEDEEAEDEDESLEAEDEVEAEAEDEAEDETEEVEPVKSLRAARFKAAVNKYITRSGDKYTVHSHAGKPMGTYDTKAEAEHRLRQIEWFKAHPKASRGRHAEDDPTPRNRLRRDELPSTPSSLGSPIDEDVEPPHLPLAPTNPIEREYPSFVKTEAERLFVDTLPELEEYRDARRAARDSLAAYRGRRRSGGNMRGRHSEDISDEEMRARWEPVYAALEAIQERLREFRLGRKSTPGRRSPVTGRRLARDKTLRRKVWVNGNRAVLLLSQGPVSKDMAETLEEMGIDDVAVQKLPPESGFEEVGEEWWQDHPAVSARARDPENHREWYEDHPQADARVDAFVRLPDGEHGWVREIRGDVAIVATTNGGQRRVSRDQLSVAAQPQESRQASREQTPVVAGDRVVTPDGETVQVVSVEGESVMVSNGKQVQYWSVHDLRRAKHFARRKAAERLAVHEEPDSTRSFTQAKNALQDAGYEVEIGNGGWTMFVKDKPETRLILHRYGIKWETSKQVGGQEMVEIDVGEAVTDKVLKVSGTVTEYDAVKKRYKVLTATGREEWLPEATTQKAAKLVVRRSAVRRSTGYDSETLPRPPSRHIAPVCMTPARVAARARRKAADQCPSCEVALIDGKCTKCGYGAPEVEEKDVDNDITNKGAVQNVEDAATIVEAAADRTEDPAMKAALVSASEKMRKAIKEKDSDYDDMDEETSATMDKALKALDEQYDGLTKTVYRTTGIKLHPFGEPKTQTVVQ